MGWGDEVVAAGQAQRLWDADPGVRIAILGEDRRPRWHPIWDGNPIIAPPRDVDRGEKVRTVINGPNARPYIVYPFTKESGWTFNRDFRCRDHVAKLYLTGEERGVGREALAEYGRYVVIEPHTKHENFRWPIARWESLVDVLRREGVTVIQHIHDLTPRSIPGAFHWYCTFRDACGLVAKADVYVRSESGMCHAAAALGVPQVTLFGGCMDPDVMAGYPGQTVLADETGSPCGSWLPCSHCAAAMDRISVEDVVEAVRSALRIRRAA